MIDGNVISSTSCITGTHGLFGMEINLPSSDILNQNENTQAEAPTFAA